MTESANGVVSLNWLSKIIFVSELWIFIATGEALKDQVQCSHFAEVETEAQRREVKLIGPGHTAVRGWSGPQPGFGSCICVSSPSLQWKIPVHVREGGCWEITLEVSFSSEMWGD